MGGRPARSWEWVLEFVVCPICRDRLALRESTADGRDGVLGHESGSCLEAYPVIGAVPRLLVDEARTKLVRDRSDWFSSSPLAGHFSHWGAESSSSTAALRLVDRFDEEWRSFSRVGTSEHETIFRRYFDVVPRSLLEQDRVALDAGCGGGRWAYEVQRHGPRVVAVDLGRSIEVAEVNTRESHRVACVQADVRELPVRPSSVDLVYSLGVLHHLEQTTGTLDGLAALVRPGGSLLVYLYYALDGRPAIHRGLFRVVDGIRSVSSRLPQPLLLTVSTAVAAVVYFPLARLAKFLAALRLNQLSDAIPLSFYADLSFATMRNDSLDRFGTRLEKRYTREAVVSLLKDAGLHDVVVSDQSPFWHAVGTRGRD